MGVVTPDQDCEYWEGLLAVEAVGQIDEADRSALHLHLVDCEHCRTVRTELSEVVGALALAEASTFDDSTIAASTGSKETRPSALDDTVLGMLAAPDPDSVRRTRHVRRVWAGLAVAAAVLVVVGTLGFLHHPGPATRTVALRGPGGSHGTAVLVPQAWGTAIELTDFGEGASEILTVSMRTEYGHLWRAGTYRSTATGAVKVTLACALPVAQIDTIAITNSAGHEVLHS